MSNGSECLGEKPSITLYRLHGCPYCELVVRRLEHYDLPYRSRFVAGEHSRRNAVERIAGVRSVPVLVDRNHGVTMPESSRIIEYLDRTYGDGDDAEAGGFDLVEFSPVDHPAEGDLAPDFTRPLVTKEYWEDVSLSALAADAGSVLLVFYPLNWGGKSIYWWKEISRRGWHDEVTVAGISVSQPFDQQRFIERRGLENPLFADPANGVAERYGIVHDLDGMTGISEPRPAAFLLNEDLSIEYAWVDDEWPPSPPYDEIESALRSKRL